MLKLKLKPMYHPADCPVSSRTWTTGGMRARQLTRRRSPLLDLLRDQDESLLALFDGFPVMILRGDVDETCVQAVIDELVSPETRLPRILIIDRWAVVDASVRVVFTDYAIALLRRDTGDPGDLARRLGR